jgi:xanthine dehydrogenase/oxidase
MYTLLRNNPQPSQAEVERAFDGNLCRCTGYRPILDGYKTFTKEFCCGQPSGSSKCCKDDTTGVISGSFALFDPKEFKSLDPTQEPIFPPELQVADLPQPLFIRGPLTEWEHEGQKRTHQALWIRPVTLDELLDAKHMYPDGKIVAGSTQISVDMKVNKLEYTTFIDPLCVPELTSVKENKDGVLIGASCSLNQIADRFSILVDKLPSYKTQALQAVLDMLCLFEGDQVKNAASMGGGLMIASPISDLNPILMSMGAEVTIASKSGGCRTAMIDDKFFVSHHKVAVEKEEVLVSISIPFTKESEHIIAYRPPQKRREESICDVNASFRIEFESNNNKEVVRSAHLVFGGCGSMIKKARKTEETITGESWDNSLLEKALESIPLDLASSPDGATGGNARYQETLSKSYFYKFYMTVLGRTTNSVPPAEATINLPSSRLLTKSCQGFQDVPLGQPSDDTIGRPVPHLSSVQHSTGTAVYIDDMPKYKNELYCGIVRSQRAHARVVGVDTSEAISIPGVWGYTGAGDIQGQESNSFAVAGVPDEVIFAEEVTYQGQTIGVVLADEEILAQRASSRVKVAYQDLPSLLSIEEAIEANSFYDYKREVIKGSVTDGFAQSDHIVTGEVHIGGQEHFYMETQAILVIPKEDGEMEIFSSTQSANGIQMQVARVTGVPSHKIRVRVKRVGGAFGGKTTAPIALACTAALAAKRSGRPVRVMLDRQEDLMSTGTRHPFLAKYKVGCTSDGKIKSAQVEVFCNGGSTQDLSGAFMEKCLCQIDNAYCIPNWHAVGRVCKTNIRSPTNFRGFGAPQAVFLAEYLIAKVAQICGLDPTRVQYHNLYHDGDSTHLNQKLVDCHLQQCWDELMKKSDFEDRKRKANNYNLSVCVNSLYSMTWRF